jgi:hypothetical protein
MPTSKALFALYAQLSMRIGLPAQIPLTLLDALPILTTSAYLSVTIVPRWLPDGSIALMLPTLFPAPTSTSWM